MTVKKRILIAVIGILMLAGGFFTVRYGMADVLGQPDPGSSQDPLVTQSYVDTQMKAQVQALQDQITAMQNQISALQNRVAALEAKVAGMPQTSTSAVTPGTGTSSTTTTTTPSTTGSKKVYVKPGLTRVNVRMGPGLSYSIIGKLNQGEAAQLVTTRSGWYCVKLPNGKAGWISQTVAVLK